MIDLNFTQIDFNENMGGIDQFAFIPWNHVRQVPNPVNGILRAPVSLYQEKSWLSGYAVKDSLTFEQEMVQSKSGKYWDVSLRGVYPNPSDTVHDLFIVLSDYRFFVIIKDRNKKFRFLGYERFPLEFKFNESSGTKASDNSSLVFTFYGKLPVPCLVYDINNGAPTPEME